MTENGVLAMAGLRPPTEKGRAHRRFRPVVAAAGAGVVRRVCAASREGLGAGVRSATVVTAAVLHGGKPRWSAQFRASGWCGIN